VQGVTDQDAHIAGLHPAKWLRQFNKWDAVDAPPAKTLAPVIETRLGFEVCSHSSLHFGDQTLQGLGPAWKSNCAGAL
jgi:hypothetical protein